MTAHSLADLGLRHVLEDFRTAFEGGALPEDRRAFVLADVGGEMAAAGRGYDAVLGEGLPDPSDFRSLRRLLGLLPESGVEAAARGCRALRDAAAALSEGRAPVERGEALAFLDALLEAVRARALLAPAPAGA